jgi:hypothetical protein
MYFRENENLGHNLAEQLCLHPSTLAHLSRSSSNLPKKVPLGAMDSLEDTSL